MCNTLVDLSYLARLHAKQGWAKIQVRKTFMTNKALAVRMTISTNMTNKGGTMTRIALPLMEVQLLEVVHAGKAPLRSMSMPH